LVHLFYNPDIELGKQVIKAVDESGGRVIEFTSRGDFAYQVFDELVKFCAKELPEMVLGVVSIKDAATAAHYMQLGG